MGAVAFLAHTPKSAQIASTFPDLGREDPSHPAAMTVSFPEGAPSHSMLSRLLSTHSPGCNVTSTLEREREAPMLAGLVFAIVWFELAMPRSLPLSLSFVSHRPPGGDRVRASTSTGARLVPFGLLTKSRQCIVQVGPIQLSLARCDHGPRTCGISPSVHSLHHLAQAPNHTHFTHRAWPFFAFLTCLYERLCHTYFLSRLHDCTQPSSSQRLCGVAAIV